MKKREYEIEMTLNLIRDFKLPLKCRGANQNNIQFKGGDLLSSVLLFCKTEMLTECLHNAYEMLTNLTSK